MKVTFISDLHGKDCWRKIIENKSDLYVFLGDYFDSFTIKHKDQLKNFEEILFFTENNRDKVQLLLGNHDVHYVLWHTEHYESMRGSGWSSSLVYKVNELYREHEELFKVIWQRGAVLATHAGVCQNYYDNELKKYHSNYKDLSIADFLNMLWKSRSGLLMRIGKERGGEDKWGGIFWAGMKELLRDPLQNFTQVIGHTPISNIKDTKTDLSFYSETWDKNTRLVFTDCLDTKEEFFEMEVD